MLRPALLLLVLLGIPLLGTAADASDTWEGRTAPSWSGTAMDGGKVSSDALRGRVVVLNFWSTTCAPCRQELKELTRLHSELNSKGVTIIGMAMPPGDAGQARALAVKLGVTFPVVYSPRGLTTAYAVAAAPTTVVVGRDGRVVRRHTGALSREELTALLTPLIK